MRKESEKSSSSRKDGVRVEEVWERVVVDRTSGTTWTFRVTSGNQPMCMLTTPSRRILLIVQDPKEVALDVDISKDMAKALSDAFEAAVVKLGASL